MAAIDPGFARSPVTPGDRFTFTLFLALVIHAAIILGVTFTYNPKVSTSHTMDVTLAQHRSKNAPDNPDYVAQFNQQGSGTLAKKRMTTTTREAAFHDDRIHHTSPKQQVAAAPKVKRALQPVVATLTRTRLEADTARTKAPPKPAQSRSHVRETLLQRSLEIASLEARLDEQRELYAKRPRITRLTSLSTVSRTDAYYLNSWRRKIERIGNLNYPAEARQKGIYGSLRLLVAIYPDGSLKEVKLLQSSGYPVLDQAAIRIVKLAAPFAPFPDQMRRTTDVLEIIRTWQFRKSATDSGFRTEF